MGGRPYLVYPKSMCGLVFLLDLMLWQGFAWKSSLPSQGFLQWNKRNTHTHTCPSTMSSLTQIQRIIVVLGCKDLSNQFTTILFRISIQSHKVQTPSRTIHKLNMLHINHSKGWITNFPKGDSLSQWVVDSEATNTWEMPFHPHNTYTSMHKNSAA